MTSAPSHASASVHEVPASNWVRSRTFTSSNAVFCDMVWPLLSANGSVPAHVSFFGAPRYVRYATPILPRQKSLTDLDDAPRATHHPARRVPSGRRGRLRESPFMSPTLGKRGAQAMDRERLRTVVALLSVLSLPILLLVAAPAVA